MISYRGRRCEIKQYLKNKPVKYGIKIWAAADAQSRYIYNLDVYTGKKGDSAEKDLDTRVVLQMVQGLENRGHVIVTDRFFTSPRLFDELLGRGFWATGTVLHYRVGMPSALHPFAKTVHLPRGRLLVKMHRSR